MRGSAATRCSACSTAPALLVTQPPPTTAQAQTPARHSTRTDVRMRELF
jgi:hypothetical protein